ncbi:Lrp/AsnC family transcriptional regulator [Nonomuraea sp. NPDC049141]|uniref:Lrp/AsnC family transcriptional regulator n=1 Tax=Nonomuraea sp. NPDC049141 TaxID=3155500 RepID=UPI00340D524D
MADLDARPLLTMHAHARIGLTELAPSAGRSQGTVQARAEKLTARGVIEDFGPTISPNRAGYVIPAFAWLRIAQGRLMEAVAALARLTAGCGTCGSKPSRCCLPPWTGLLRSVRQLTAQAPSTTLYRPTADRRACGSALPRLPSTAAARDCPRRAVQDPGGQHNLLRQVVGKGTEPFAGDHRAHPGLFDGPTYGRHDLGVGADPVTHRTAVDGRIAALRVSVTKPL